MKNIFLMLACAFFSLNVFGQTETPPTADEVKVEEISVARDNGKGEPADDGGGNGEAAKIFTTIDVPLHCLVKLNSIKTADVKMNLVAVAAGDLKPETIVVSVSFKTNGKQKGVRFDVSPAKGEKWIAGKYRADIFIDNRKDRSAEFEIQKSASDNAAGKQNPPPLTPKKQTAKPKTTGKNPKNKNSSAGGN